MAPTKPPPPLQFSWRFFDFITIVLRRSENGYLTYNHQSPKKKGKGTAQKPTVLS